MNGIRKCKQMNLAISIAFAGSLALAAPAVAQVEPLSYQASPDIYKVIAENERFKLIHAHWKPGDRDAWHSHDGPGVLYWLTDCTTINHRPNGTNRQGTSKKGAVGSFPAVASHALENAGATDCEMLLVEPK